MATRPDKKPRWATVPTVNPTTLKNNVIEPTEGKKDLGWDYLEKPARNFMNWVLNKAYEWIDYFDQNTQFLVLENDPTPDLSFKLQGGTYITQGNTLVTIADATLGPVVAPAVNPRIDRVILNKSTGVISITTGVEAGSPVPVALLTNEIALSQIALVVAQTQIVNADITDERPLWDTTLAASLIVAGISEFSTDAEAIAKTDTTRSITPSNLAALDASTTFKGLIEIGTDAEVQAGSLTDKVVTPASLATVAEYTADVTNYVKATNVFLLDHTIDPPDYDIQAVIGAAYESVGPTGSGATNIWTAIDAMPTNTKSILLRFRVIAQGSTNASSYSGVITARRTGSGAGLGAELQTVSTQFINRSGLSEQSRDTSEVGVPVDSNRRFDIRLDSSGTSVSVTATMSIHGFAS